MVILPPRREHHDAFSEAAETVPPNWTRLFFIPATDRNAIHALELNRRQT